MHQQDLERTARRAGWRRAPAVNVVHPRIALLGSKGALNMLPVCDHYSGVEARMVKSLQLQAQMMQEFGACVFDVTLDCEDGAPVGNEKDQANLVVAFANSASTARDLVAGKWARRVGVRVHPVGHPVFEQDVRIVVGAAAAVLSYIMVPKVESVADVQRAVAAIDGATKPGTRHAPVPLHVLIESPAAVHAVFGIASHPRVESVSFGLMDFVSAHGGAIASCAMGVRKAEDQRTLDQFHHPLVVRAKLEIASACHAFGKVPSHCVVTEYRDAAVLKRAAQTAASALGFTRMWSIHPDQIRPILEAFSPPLDEVEMAAEIVVRAQAQDWAPFSMAGKLHDRASFRYFWQLLERAHQTGVAIPALARQYFPATVH
jgi:citrate lyase subunit beta/citryl-CoA lyase